jgi:hypothetical protein
MWRDRPGHIERARYRKRTLKQAEPQEAITSRFDQQQAPRLRVGFGWHRVQPHSGKRELRIIRTAASRTAGSKNGSNAMERKGTERDSTAVEGRTISALVN